MAEKKYIEVDYAIEYCTEHIDGIIGLIVKDAIKKIPTADVAEVVRCKDCKYSHENDYSIKCELHIPYCYEVNENGFCSRGERKDKEND